ncbi:MAG: hypothetical protein Q7R95_10000 [bacterium]|nr:hypothetical protein [bacterium]
MKTLFAGPFVGELGYEVFEWQGYMRKLSKNFDSTIICSRPGHEILYKDFYSEFVPLTIDLCNCAGWTNYRYKYKKGIHEKYNPCEIVYVDNESDAASILGNLEQEFIAYGNKSDEDKTDIIIHARDIKMNDSYKRSRNWPIRKWEALVGELITYGFTVGSIGTSECARYIDGTKNFMDIGLMRLADILSSSTMIVGPSSGPMHFATLCKCPQFVWTSNKVGIGHQNRYNYEKKWNPFGTKVMVYEEGGWNPSEKEVYDAIIKLNEDILKN